MEKERRDRKVHPMLGAGTLIWGSAMSMRFESDGGSTLRFDWARLDVGTPDYVKRSKRKKDLKRTEEEERWMTIETTKGEVLAFRAEDAPPEPMPQAAPQQLALI